MKLNLLQKQKSVRIFKGLQSSSARKDDFSRSKRNNILKGAKYTQCLYLLREFKSPRYKYAL